jgi:hypothetical protein
MAKEWANKDKYHPSDGVLEPRVQMPRAKANVRTVQAWGERKAVGGAVVQVTLVRPVQAWTGSGLGFGLVQVRGLFLEVVVLVVGLESLQLVRLLGILPLEIGGFGPPPGREGWFPQGGYRGGVCGGSFGRRDALVGANPLSSKWLGTGFTLLVLSPLMCRLFAHVLVFEFQVGDFVDG